MPARSDNLHQDAQLRVQRHTAERPDASTRMIANAVGILNGEAVAACRGASVPNSSVTILMCTHNGGRFIAEQLDTTARQTHPNWRLLVSDNGSSYIAGELADYIEDKGMQHVRGAPYHPQTQGKIERWHQTMKNRVLLEHYCLPGDLERQISDFVDYYNNRRYHESLGNVTPADVYFGRDQQILKQREEIKRKTMLKRRLRHQTDNA